MSLHGQRMPVEPGAQAGRAREGRPGLDPPLRKDGRGPDKAYVQGRAGEEESQETVTRQREMEGGESKGGHWAGWREMSGLVKRGGEKWKQ